MIGRGSRRGSARPAQWLDGSVSSGAMRPIPLPLHAVAFPACPLSKRIFVSLWKLLGLADTVT